MELRLQKYIESMQQLANIRNVDPLNPTIFKLEHPVSATEYVTVASIVEPSHLGLPINTTWTVLDPTSQHYLKALKLKGAAGSTPPEGVTPAAGLTQVWQEITAYAEIFSDPQYYDMVGGIGPMGPPGPPGPAGPAGPKGDTGPAGQLDFNALVQAVKDALAQPDPTLSIDGPDSVNEQGTGQYQVMLNTNPPTPVQAQISLSSTLWSTIDSTNKLSVQPLDVSQTVTLNATYVLGSKTLHATKTVTLTVATLIGLVISGVPQTTLDGVPFHAVATAKYDGAPDAQVSVEWAVVPPSAGTIDALGNFTPNPASGDTPFTITATYTENGVTFNDNKGGTIIKVIPTTVSISGPSTVFEGLTAQFTATGTANDGTNGVVTPQWSVNPTTAGSINASGLFTATQVAADTVVEIKATYTLNGATAIDTKNLTVVNLVPDSLTITGATTVFEGLTTTFTASAHKNDGTSGQVQPTWSVSPSSAGTISSAGLFTAALQTADVNATINASYTSGGATVTASKAINVKNIIPTALNLTAAATALNEGQTTQLTANVTRNDSSTANVTTTCSYVVAPSSAGTVSSSGLFTAAQVTANQSCTVTASYVESGVTVTKSVTITVNDVAAATPFPYYGAASSTATKNAALILSLTGRGTTADRLNSDLVIIDGVGKSMYYAYPKSYGLATFTDKSNGFQGGWDGAAGAGDGTTLGPIEVTVNGVVFYLYKTDQSNISPASNPTHWSVT